MRYRLMATYRGVPYEAGIGPSEADVVLFAACPPPEELGFEPATGHWRKRLRIDEVQALWESRPTGTFRGERCIVLDDLGDRLHIAYLGHDALQAEQLGYWQVDRGVFELITPRDEVTDVVEERTDYPGHGGSVPPARGGGQNGASLLPPWPARPDAGQPDAARPQAAPLPPQDAAATRLADLAAATLAHLASMSQTPSRAADAESPLGSEIAMPPPEEQPLPLEAAARRAASAATAAMRRQRRDPAAGPQDPPAGLPQDPAAGLPLDATAGPLDPAAGAGDLAAGPRDPAAGPRDPAAGPRDPAAGAQSPAAGLRDAGEAGPQGPAAGLNDPAAGRDRAAEAGDTLPRRRRTARKRVATQGIFSELAGLAAIPATAYAVGAEVDGAMCLVQTEQGFEVFNAVSGARHEVRSFQDEESAYFYLFGVLAADAVRTGKLAPAAG